MSNTTFSISFYCRPSKVNKHGVAPLELCLNINQERLFVNLPVKFNPKVFAKKKKPADIEQLLNEYKTKVNEVIATLMKEGIPITASTLRDYLRTGGTKSKTIKNLTDEYLVRIKSKVGKTLTEKVYRKYELVRDFLFEELGKDTELCTINNGHIVQCYEILKQRFLPSTSAGYMVKIKSMFYYAVDNGMMKTNPANSIKVNKGAVKVEYLSSDDLAKIRSLDLADIDRLDKVRDLMLFQASVGVAYCDLVCFDSSLIVQTNGVFTYTGNRQKTGIEYTTVILPEGLKILEKYNGQLPLISNQKYNANLKDIQRLAGVKTNITTHLLRKTYAHRMLNAGVKIDTVARLLGHSNSIITQRIYCKKTTSTVAGEVAAVIEKLGSTL